MIPKSSSTTFITGTMIAIAAFFLFFNLGASSFWQDEAEVAMLARRITQSGLPITWDGDFFITQENGQDSQLLGDTPVWSWSTWGQYYLTAASFSIFGPSNFSGRLPFAALGLGVIILTAITVKLANKSSALITTTIALLAFSVPLLLYARQDRYYMLNLFTIMFMAIGYLFAWRRHPRGFIIFLIASLIGFHSTNFLLWGAGFAGIWAHFISMVILKKLRFLQKSTWAKASPVSIFNQLTIVTAFTIVQALIWFSLISPSEDGGHLGFFLKYWGGFSGFFSKINNYLILTDAFYLPLVIPVLAVIISAFNHRHHRLRIDPLHLLAATMIIIQIIFIALFVRFGQRYLVNIIPWSAIILASVVTQLWRQKKLIAAFLLILLVATNFVHQVSGRLWHPGLLTQPLAVRSYLRDFTSELLTPARGPVDGAIDYLKANAKAGDTIAVGYEQTALKFYLPQLKIAGSTATIDSQVRPNTITDQEIVNLDFIVPRTHWKGLNILPKCVVATVPDHFIAETVDAPDTQWQNMPDITYHRFTTDVDTSPLVIWRRTSSQLDWQKSLEIKKCISPQ